MLHSIKFLTTDQVIIMILTLLSVVILRQLHHQIYGILSDHPVVIVVTGNDCFRKEVDIIHRQEWRELFENGTKIMLYSDITKRNIKQVGGTFGLDRMVFQS